MRKIPELDGKAAERFWAKVNKTNDCWLWTACKVSGYGAFGMNGTHYKAHRVSFIMHNGDIPEGYDVCHSCDNPLCVNPHHLFAGTEADNMRDMKNKNRNNSCKGEGNAHAKLKEQDVITIRNEYAKGGATTRELASRYGVTSSTISAITRRLKWRHVQEVNAYA